MPYRLQVVSLAMLSLAMPTTPLSSTLSPDQLKRLADRHIAQAARIECGYERQRMLTLADALTNLAEVKRLLLDYERRLLN
jgi:hypothetical protein